MNKTVNECVEREEKTIYMGKIREISLKRDASRLSEQPKNHTLANEDMPRGPYAPEVAKSRVSELEANPKLLSTQNSLKLIGFRLLTLLERIGKRDGKRISIFSRHKSHVSENDLA